MVRRHLPNALVLAVAILLALLLGEALVRFLSPLSTVEYRIDPDVGQILVPNQKTRWVNADYDVMVVTNSAGFHDVEHTVEKPRDVYRIVVIGDSFVEALQVPIQEGFTQQLERTLQQGPIWKRVEVINLATSGTGPAQYYRVLQMKGMVYQPDLVVMAVLPDNDFRDSYQSLGGTAFKPYYTIRPDGALEYMPPHSSGFGADMRPLFRRSALLQLARKAIVSLPIEGWLANVGLLAPAGALGQESGQATIPMDWYVYVKEPPQPWPDAYRVTLRMIKESKDLAEREGAEFLVMVIASTQSVEQRWEEALRRYGAAKTLTFDFQRPYREIAKLGQQAGFEVISLIEPFRQDFLSTHQSHAWLHDGHWNGRGHKLAAEVVGSYLLDHRQAYHLN